jgi:hypothetical protein
MKTMWRPGRGKQVENLPEEFDGKVTVSIVVNAVDRQTREVKIIIIEKQSEDVVFKGEFTTSLKEHLAYENGRDIVKAFVRNNDYYIDGEITNIEKAVMRTVKRTR